MCSLDEREYIESVHLLSISPFRLINCLLYKRTNQLIQIEINHIQRDAMRHNTCSVLFTLDLTFIQLTKFEDKL